MPYVLRDGSGKIVKVSSFQVPTAEGLPADHPELLTFLNHNGVSPDMVEGAIKELRRTDSEMSRAIEDLITALLKKNVLKMSDLPRAVQDRIAFRISLRMQIQQAYDRASGTAQQQTAPANTPANA